ncbi:hypothetical protein [Metabacillus rhizolycopersici]|uniref:Uncharacterized protein n=1 Tax=Metabacillus rhizolycopersici TaxID=2875709 RepID=A0ABS7UVW5_9BACI|nr:hypothetical protein [Metabacillus rhizolycopersici]MBZ5752446.1 hypothetical protein [Metabacillus rhizolycopersici]
MTNNVNIKFKSGNEFHINAPKGFDNNAFLNLVEKGKMINAPFEFPRVDTAQANESFRNIDSISFK